MKTLMTLVMETTTHYRFCLTTMSICEIHLSPIVLVISSPSSDSDASRFPTSLP